MIKQADKNYIIKPEDLDQVEIQVASWCNRTCDFCPSGNFPIPKERMSMESVERIIAELERFSFSGTIGLHLMCEPLLHNKIAEIITLFRQRLPDVFIRLESNGDALNKMERLGTLFDCGLNEALINCYDSQEQFEERNRKLLELHPSGGPIWYWNHWQRFPVTPKKKWRLVRLRAFYEAGFTLSSWAGLVELANPKEEPFPLSLPCSRPTKRLHLNYLGEVLVCNMDWKNEVIVGNLIKQSLEEVINSPILLNYRYHLDNRNRDHPLCKRCDSGSAKEVEPGYPPSDGWVEWRSRWFDLTRRIRRKLSMITE